jgi:hypothetical protein
VKVGAAVEAGQLVHYDATTGEISNAGGTLIEGAVFESAAAEDGLAKVRLNGVLPAEAPGT